MTSLTSIQEIDLTPLPGKTYFNITREWREEFIYFLLVDRFHDDIARSPVLQPGRSQGIRVPNTFYGGRIKGITRNLNYIAGLGCTAIWLSPIFENYVGAYHGYNINNYLNVDPNFGTKQDLIDLIEAAHNYKKNGQPYPIRVLPPPMTRFTTSTSVKIPLVKMGTRQSSSVSTLFLTSVWPRIALIIRSYAM